MGFIVYHANVAWLKCCGKVSIQICLTPATWASPGAIQDSVRAGTLQVNPDFAGAHPVWVTQGRKQANWQYCLLFVKVIHLYIYILDI